MFRKVISCWLYGVVLLWGVVAVAGEDVSSEQPVRRLAGKQYNSSATVLDNGMEVVLVENHANPMVACFVIVRSGQRDETEDIAGIGHFLEHAIFDGTEHRSKKQLYDDFDFLGSYVNASTKHDYTEFFVLSPKETFPQSLDLLTDMVFHSVFPPDTLEQERGIVMEEIRKDLDRPAEEANNLFNRMFFRGTPYAHPILGSVPGIEELSRSRLVEFYRAHYIPNNMVCVVIGDLDPPGMFDMVESAFGEYPPGVLPDKKLLSLSSLYSSYANQIITYRGDVDRCYLQVGIEVPTWWSEDYYAVQILTDIIEPHLQENLIVPGDSSITGINLSEFEDRDFAALMLHVDIGSEELAPRAVDRLFRALSALHYWITRERIDAAIQARRSNDILQGQRLHMYGLLNSGIFARGGYPLWRFQYHNMEQVTVADILSVADKYLNDPAYVAVCLAPFRGKPEVSEREMRDVGMVRDTLGNGMVVLIEQNTDAPIFAAHILAKGRSVREGPGRAGYADMLHRLMASGNLMQDGSHFREALQRIGAELVATDIPWIPYDDYRTSPTHSFLRLECLDDFYEEGLGLLSGMITQFVITPESLSRVRKELLGVLSAQNARVSKRADRLFLKTMLGADDPLAQPEFGTMETVANASQEELWSFFNNYFSGSNLILTVITSHDPEVVLETVRSEFTLLPQAQLPPVELAPPSGGRGRIEEVAGKQQSGVRIGAILRSVDPADRAALEVWNGWVGDQLAFVIREERGWAYSIGSSLWFVNDWVLWEASWGTSPATVDTSILEAREIIEQCIGEMPSERDLRRIIHQLFRSGGMRRMTRINQAMYLGLSEFDGIDRDWDRWSQALEAVTRSDVHRVAHEYMDRSEVVEVVVR
jgi:zinc protease